MTEMWKGGRRESHEDRRLQRDLDDEFEFHIEERTKELEGKGLGPSEARTRAVAEFGDALRAREDCTEINVSRARDQRRREWVGGIAQDVRFAWRALLRTPAVTTAAVLTLALGISANALLFTAISRVLLHPLPGVRDREALVWITPTEDGRPTRLSYPLFKDLLGIPGLVAGAAIGDLEVALRTDGVPPQRLSAQVVSPQFFEVLHTSMTLGRSFQPEEHQLPVAVLSHALWLERFGGETSILGRTILLNGIEFTVIGVAEELFSGVELDQPADLWIPIESGTSLAPQIQEWLTQRGTYWLTAVGRLEPRASFAGARASAALIASRGRGSDDRVGADIFPLSSSLRPGATREVVPIATLAFATTLAILLIAGANVATLLLSRASAREHEIAIRLALGAGRARIVSLLLTESLLMAMAGAGLGLLVTIWGSSVARASDAPAALQLGPDGIATGATLLLGVISGVLCGLAPVWGMTWKIGSVLKGGGGSRGERSRFRGALVVGQVALSVLMLATAGPFLRSLARVVRSEPGFEARGDVLTVSFNPSSLGYDSGRARRMEDELIRTLGSDPAVRSAAISDDVPMSGRIVQGSVEVEDQAGEWVAGNVAIVRVSPGFFDVLGIPVLLGRAIGPSDGQAQARVAMVNEEFVRRYRLGDGPIARRVKLGAGEAISIVGVAGNVRWEQPGQPIRPYLFLPLAQHPAGVTTERTVVVRASGNPAPLAQRVATSIQSMEPNLPVYDVMTMQQRIDRSPREQRIAAFTLACFGALALLLASIGVYGVTSYAVARRTREIGIRLALGARPDSIRKLFLWRSGRLVVIGISVGLLGATGLLRLVASMLVGVSAFDPAIFAVVAGLLSAVAVLASWLPATRAMRIQPIGALRSE